VHAAGEYDGVLRAVLLAHKERSALGLAAPLGRVLADAVGAAAASRAVILVPVPSHPAVVRARGHDPLLRVVRRTARVLRARGTEAEVRRPLRVVGRPRDQAGLGAAERRSNVRGRFGADAPRRRSSRVLLVDDVVTTGATLDEGQRALTQAGWDLRGAVTLAATRRRSKG
jgi:predicted amidophosphoribosyltransferase